MLHYQVIHKEFETSNIRVLLAHNGHLVVTICSSKCSEPAVSLLPTTGQKPLHFPVICVYYYITYMR